ncbi:dihydroxyacetone kinase phosphoryl donor subunit DhaM [Saccharothrix sp. NPDC042600]|uniref:dihydroxyacetone kinase phosphoryl donor subunit DhaM n=1 Tax=Saccharothrix TaxID=2071 RepID=UPI00340CD4A1|nr:dihydroxyacetone kinase phosphoryl donor subunit DhaM [Saccharothrix mutabilis subsp. capreolus]
MIGLVVVSHSRRLAEGVAELAGQMAPDVTIVPAGGDGAGGLGTDFLAVSEAVARAGSAGVVVLYDLGSARMVADMAAEEAGTEVRVVDAPLVEGAVAAAVAAQGNATLDAVATAATRAAAEAGWTSPESGGSGGIGAVGAGEVRALGVAGGVRAPAGVAGEVRARVVLTNEVGLHARPAALVARSLTGLDARVVVRFGDAEADAASVLALMGLSAPGGASVEVVASGADAAEAVRRVEDLAARGFDE